ncbi:type I site-specific deoxyribonuclease, HsdR family [Thiorhodovibrio litoralis]|nr:type I site-specific deoxyribonuclease, HsdR family [Thiorhodovibrio litoralis]
MAFLTEADIEQALLAELGDLGYQTTTEAQIGHDGPAAEREAFADVLLLGRLQAAIDRLNPELPPEARADALRQVVATVSPSLIEENRRLHGLITEGAKIEYYAKDGTLIGGRVWLIDFEHPDKNDWLAVGQFTVIEAGQNRRADVVIFINGLPLVVELKSPSSVQATITHAYNQLQTYKAEIPSLFRTNAALVISDGQMARIGSLTANAERFMRWLHRRWRDHRPRRHPRAAGAGPGRAGARAAADPAARVHCLWAHRGRADQDPRRLSPIPSGAQGDLDHHRRHQSDRRPPHRRDLAHPRLRQKPADGLLRRPTGAPPGHGQPDHRRATSPKAANSPNAWKTPSPAITPTPSAPWRCCKS